ncbi:MAG TPA: TonB-dependent receptor [Pyrinomonadaceae bacterium]
MTTQRPVHFALRFLLLFALCALPLAAAHAQSAAATLSGTVGDQNGAAIPGVTVTVVNKGTQLKREATTNEQGVFTIPLLPPGGYTVRAQGQGFAPAEFTNLVLNVNDQKSLQIQLKAGDVNAQVQVLSEAPLINESPAVATTIDRQFVGNLPLNGRSFQSLILLTPGVVFTTTTTSNIGEFSVNGQRSNANYFTVDGVSANFGITPNPGPGGPSSAVAGALPALSASGGTNTLVSVDALEEFKIQTSTYSAEFGRQPGGQVQLVTRAGTNDFHGSAYDYVRNEIFDARNYFNTKPQPKPPLRQNQFGGTFSGPVMLPRFGEGGKAFWNSRNRTFFFFSYEGQRLRLPVFANEPVPSMRLRQIPNLNPAMRSVLNAFPLPTQPETIDSTGTPTGAARFVGAYSNPKSLDSTGIRIDHTLSSKHTIFGRYNQTPSRSLSRFLALLYGLAADTRTLTLGATSSITNRITNEFRFNYGYNRAQSVGSLDNFGGAVPVGVSTFLPGYSGPLNKVQGGVALITAGGFMEIQSGNATDFSQRQLNFVDNMSWTSGEHQLRFGFDYRRLAPIYGSVQYRQDVTALIFNNVPWTNFDEARFVSGDVRQVSVNGEGTGARPRFDNFSVYAMDTWKVSRRLTFDLGLRWELNPAPTEENGRLPVLVVGAENMATARLSGPDEPWYKTSYTAFAPRFGVAYQLREKSGRETVLRGGFGVYYDLNSGQAAGAYQGFPFRVEKFLLGVPWPITPAQAVIPPQPNVALPITDTLYAVNTDFALPYTLQWNFSVEQSLGARQAATLSYVGSVARRLTTNQRLNQQVASTGTRPNPNFGDVNFITNGPASDYHAFQAQYQRRFSRGFQALVNYTWSHAIDDVSNEVDQGTLERGNASFDVRHNFSAAFTYDIPKLKGVPVITPLLSGWSLDSSIFAFSGQPVDIKTFTQVVRGDGSFVSVRPDLVAGQPLWVNDPAAPGGRRINVAAFADPPLDANGNPQRQGTLGRNVVRQPGVYQVNLALRRNFKLTERWNLQLKAEAFNLLNHPMFSYDGYPAQYFETGSTSFGKANTTLNKASNAGSGASLNSLYQMGGPRSFQFSARFSF